MAPTFLSCQLAPAGVKALLNMADDKRPQEVAIEFDPLERSVRKGRPFCCSSIQQLGD